jgi:Protein of unknown function (DUF1569)
VNNLFEKHAYNEIIGRIHQLTTNSQRLWGKMDVAQMLAHTKVAFKVPLSKTPMPRMLLGKLIGWAIKAKLYNEEPWKKNLPTAPEFKITNQRDFEVEKNEIIKLINQFHESGPENVGNFPHPFFGSYTKEQWGKSMYKHLDHHLKQFGV